MEKNILPDPADIEKLLDSLLSGSKPQSGRAREFFDEFRLRMLYYRCAMKEIETKIEVLDEEFSLRFDRNPIASVSCRLKEAKSIFDKMRRKNFPLSLESMEEKIDDIAGIRVICPFLEDVYDLERALLEQDDISLIERKDYIKEPKSNGYRSLHLVISVPIFLSGGKRIIKVEVQIRTIAMDSWASLEHQLRYKKDYCFTKHAEGELKLCADLSAELDGRMEMLRRSIIGD
jgi:putative GTP pyrophosphokinase